MGKLVSGGVLFPATFERLPPPHFRVASSAEPRDFFLAVPIKFSVYSLVSCKAPSASLRWVPSRGKPGCGLATCAVRFFGFVLTDLTAGFFLEFMSFLSYSDTNSWANRR
jgi:hypothetical protein